MLMQGNQAGVEVWVLRQRTYKANLNSSSLSTTVAHVLRHADLGIPETYTG